MDVYSRAFAENFFKPQQEWCHAHNVRLIGHLVEDNHADHQLGYGPGHWFRAMQYFDMPGIDVVGYQVTPGVDAGTYRVDCCRAAPTGIRSTSASRFRPWRAAARG